MPRTRRAIFLVGVAMLVLLGGQTIAAPGSPAKRPTLGAGGRATTVARPDAPSFSRPTISGIQGVGFEQDLRLDPTSGKRLYTSAPGSLSSDTSWIWRSVDGGQTFKWIPNAAPLTGKVNTACPGGGDTELAVDTKGHLYFIDLTLANFSTGRSENQGRTFLACSSTAVLDTPVDRQWYATDGDPTNGGDIYLTYDLVGGGEPICESSLANNVLVMARSPLAGDVTGQTAGIQFNPSEKITPLLSSCDEGIMGNNEVSPVTHHIFVIHDNATLDAILVGRCRKVSFLTSQTGLACVDLPVASFPGSKTGGDFPTMAIDTAGNLYAVWEQAPVGPGGVAGNTALFYSYSTDEGDHWASPIQVPTPGLLNNVFAWIGAGDDGRIDIGWLGTPAPVDPNGGPEGCEQGGPDAVDGDWSMFMVQSLNAHGPSPSFTPPILVGEHFVHRGSVQTLIGGQCGDRTLGDFFQLRIGRRGEAQMSFADSNNIDAAFAPHGMYARQVGGTTVSATTPVLTQPPLATNFVTDPSGDARFEALGHIGPYKPNLDILGSRISRPDMDHYRVQMRVKDLSTLSPGVGSGGTDLVWLTQWLAPSASLPEGGRNFFVYFESTDAGAPRCFSGQNAAALLGGGVALTYPGSTQITGAACSYTATSPGVITIDVPVAQVSVPDPIDSTLYSVTASTMSLEQPADSCPVASGIGGCLFNLIDAAAAYDFIP